MKTCSKCRIEKEESLFNKDSRYVGGLYCWCKECAKSYRKTPAGRDSEERHLKNPSTVAIRKARQGTARHKGLARSYEADPKTKARRKARRKERRKSEPLYDLTIRLREVVRGAFNRSGSRKKPQTLALLGAPNFEIVIIHLKNTWFQNYGTPYTGQKAHIDHIVPCASAKTECELVKLQHYTNLQLLTPYDNWTKGDSVTNKNIS